MREIAEALRKELFNNPVFSAVGVAGDKLIIYTKVKKHNIKIEEYKGHKVEIHYMGKIELRGARDGE